MERACAGTLRLSGSSVVDQTTPSAALDVCIVDQTTPSAALDVLHASSAAEGAVWSTRLAPHGTLNNVTVQ